MSSNTKHQPYTLIAGSVCFLIACWLGYCLKVDLETQTLWGSKVLWFWLSIWAAILLVFGAKISTLTNAPKLLGASILSGILLAGGFMPMPTFFLMFVGFVPLLWAEHQVSLAREDTSKWTIFKLSFCAFLTWNLISTWWIQNSSFVAGMAGNVLNSAFMCIPIVFYHVTKKNLGLRAANWGFVGYWLTFEIGHLNWDLSWPWLTLGNSFAHIPAIIQWYEFTGVFGGSLWILGLNLWIANQVSTAHEKGELNLLKEKTFLGKTLASFVLPILLSFVLYAMHNPVTDRSIEVVSVQPNYEPHYQKFSVPRNLQLRQFKKLSFDVVDENTDYLLFPETSFSGVEISDLENHPLIDTFRQWISDYPKLNLISGLSSYRSYKKEDDKPSHIFTYCNLSGTVCRYIDSHNSAIQVNNESTEIPYYQKSKFVPGAESMPFVGQFEFLHGFILKLGGLRGVSLGYQEEREVFKSKAGAVAPMICYESVYGDYVTEYTRKGAEAFFVITNDGWWDNSWGHRKHMYLSSLRAIENRRAVVRSANTGVSCYIDSRGDIYNPSKYDEPIALKDSVYLHEEVTIYSQYGDLIGRVSILLTVWLLVTILANGLRKGRN